MSGEELDPETTLGALLQHVRDGVMADLRVGMPGKVVTWDAANGRCVVQPMINPVRAVGGTLEESTLPLVHHVPVLYPCGGGFRLTWPLRPGDPVWLMFADRALDVYLETGQQRSPGDSRKHHLTDPVAIPGVRPWSNPIPSVSPTDLTIGLEDGSGEIVIKADGTVCLGGGAASLGVARHTDPTKVDNESDAAFVQWMLAVHTVMVGLSGLTTPPLTPLSVLGTAYQAASPSPPLTVTGAIGAASEQVKST